jgi:tRNA-dihydrouridine synthase A
MNLVSIAPMMDVTDRHCRYFFRVLAPGARLYTEMLTAQAVVHGDRAALLGFDVAEHPVAVQLAGQDPALLAEAARIAAGSGYDEINLNVGCPSGRVRDGGFGACLMLEPGLVARCVEAMSRAVAVPVTVKTRTGVDDHDSFEFLASFVRTVAGAGCRTFVIHARKALLEGLSPRENRVVPPLCYERVHRLKAEFPQLTVVVNGGITTLDGIAAQLTLVDGVMLGRKVAEDPYFLADVQREFLGGWNEGFPPDRAEVVARMYEYARREIGRGARLHHITRHMLGLYHGVPGARRWRRFLSGHVCRTDAPAELLLRSLEPALAAGVRG